MSARPPTDDQIAGALRAHLPSEAPAELRERIRAQANATHQERRLPWLVSIGSAGRPLATAAVAVAAVLVVAILGGGLLGRLAEAGAPSPILEGALPPGRYLAYPLPRPHARLSVTFSVPAGWEAQADPGGLGLVLLPVEAPGAGPPGGTVIQFLDVTTLNDPCRWRGTVDDVAVGPSVADLVGALSTQTAYSVSDPVDVTIGGQSGKRVDLVMPTEPFVGQTASARGCSGSVFRPWSTTAHGDAPAYAQGPANRWQVNILDVGGTRLVIVVADFPATSAADRAQLDTIISSLRIEP